MPHCQAATRTRLTPNRAFGFITRSTSYLLVDSLSYTPSVLRGLSRLNPSGATLTFLTLLGVYKVLLCKVELIGEFFGSLTLSGSRLPSARLLSLQAIGKKIFKGRDLHLPVN